MYPAPNEPDITELLRDVRRAIAIAKIAEFENQAYRLGDYVSTRLLPRPMAADVLLDAARANKPSSRAWRRLHTDLDRRRLKRRGTRMNYVDSAEAIIARWEATDAGEVARPLNGEQPRRPRKKFERTSTTTIMATEFEDIKWVVPGYVSEGFLVLAGRQKLGKTWLAIDMAVAVATGGVAMGSICCEQGDVLYIDMENGPRRIQSRINAIFPDERNRPDLSRLEWVIESPQLDAGFIGELERWRTSVREPRFVIIDVLQRIKPTGSMARNSYENDYSAWAPLQQWATETGIAVLGLHHTRKGGADDPLEALSGSNGLSACADTTLVLDSDQNGKTLYVRGRDVEEKETALIFTAGIWTLLGEASEVRRSDERSVIVEALTDNAEPMTPAELAAALGKQSNNIRQLLFKMAKAGEVYKLKGSRYWINPVDPPNTDNSSNAAWGGADE